MTPQEIEALKAERDAAMREASELAMSIWRTEFQKLSPDFELCDSPAGIISQIDNMYAAIRGQRDALTAQVEAMREQLQIAHDCITCADETGYVQDVGFVDLEAVALELKLAIEATPQQCLRDVKVEAGRKGFIAGARKWVAAVHPVYAEDAIPDIEADADKYAAKVRQGGAE